MTEFFRIKDAEVRRGGKTILSVDNLGVSVGESIAILGPNGSGKTTFVNLITREVLPLYRDEPPFVLKGNPRPVLQDIRKSIGIVSPSMDDQIRVDLPVIDIVAGGLFATLGLPHHLSVSEGDRVQALQALRSLHMEELADRPMGTLSSGQRRRVLVARALISNPEAVIFDEPCTGLDPEGMYYVRQAMRDFAQSGRSVILVTHYPEDIVPEIRRILFIKEGRITKDGPKEVLLTSSNLSELFQVPLEVSITSMDDADYYSVVAPY